ncbi:hypothetical protein [Hydrogenophaga sp. BPS33]|uniref:hypothetical protein n=1 Tax=Hydrogenophaga sp. BPS33 TaxID=2651974 RepID=UPI00132056BD|nr:hypothetical protein [Hydrogenophaga sp. BPS33]QHE86646.1 hypothetical protein F9K07_17945 [Hydrogenophaga sp. BPS33]
MSPNHQRADSGDDLLIHYLPHVLIGVMLVMAGMLMAGFLSVLDDIAERGEMRRQHQRATGSVLLGDEVRTSVSADTALLSVR